MAINRRPDPEDERSTDPHGPLECALIDEFLAERGHTLLSVGKLRLRSAGKLRRAASYATLKLAEIDRGRISSTTSRADRLCSGRCARSTSKCRTTSTVRISDLRAMHKVTPWWAPSSSRRHAVGNPELVPPLLTPRVCGLAS